MKTFVIIGAGFCGAVTAAQLLRKAAEPIEIVLLNRLGLMARGLAYGTRTDAHVLNVPAGRMSAYPDDEDSFLRYAQHQNAELSAHSFVSRRVFGDYLEWIVRDASRAAPAGSIYRPMVGDVKRIEVLTSAEHASARIHLVGKKTLDADRVVLALGNFAPSDPQVDGSTSQIFYSSPRYVRDPWRADALWVVKPDEPVLLIGTGLTMLDTMLSLRGRGHRGAIHALSRRGLLPQTHRELEHRPIYASDLPQRLPATPSARSYLRGLRNELARMAGEGVDWRDIIGGLRGATPALWQALPQRERGRFLRHLRTFWETHRHRCAPAISRQFDAERADGTLMMHAGRIAGFDEHVDGVDVLWRPRGKTEIERIAAGCVINCTGPESDTRSVAEPLIVHLRETGMIQPDGLGLGLIVDSNYRLVSRNGEASPVLHYVGPFLRAQYWEATAVPELRQHVERLADELHRDLIEVRTKSISTKTSAIGGCVIDRDFLPEADMAGRRGTLSFSRKS